MSRGGLSLCLVEVRQWRDGSISTYGTTTTTTTNDETGNNDNDNDASVSNY
jgi:hypothetical protein